MADALGVPAYVVGAGANSPLLNRFSRFHVATVSSAMTGKHWLHTDAGSRNGELHERPDPRARSPVHGRHWDKALASARKQRAIQLKTMHAMTAENVLARRYSTRALDQSNHQLAHQLDVRCLDFGAHRQ